MEVTDKEHYCAQRKRLVLPEGFDLQTDDGVRKLADEWTAGLSRQVRVNLFWGARLNRVLARQKRRATAFIRGHLLHDHAHLIHDSRSQQPPIAWDFSGPKFEGVLHP